LPPLLTRKRIAALGYPVPLTTAKLMAARVDIENSDSTSRHSRDRHARYTRSHRNRQNRYAPRRAGMRSHERAALGPNRKRSMRAMFSALPWRGHCAIESRHSVRCQKRIVVGVNRSLRPAGRRDGPRTFDTAISGIEDDEQARFGRMLNGKAIGGWPHSEFDHIVSSK